jgi:excisionase family DNA binding protein
MMMNRNEPLKCEGPLLTVAEVARYLRIHEKTVYTMVARRELPSIRLGRRVRFSPDDILRWVSARKEG